METIKILIADDHHLVAESLSMLLSSVEDFQIVGIASNGWQAISFIEKNSVDIVLADYHMPLLNGIEMTTKLKEINPKVKSIMLTMSEEAHHIKRALQVGVYGYVLKSAKKPELITAIKTVAKGERYFSENVVRKLAELPEDYSPSGKTRVEDVAMLTKREMEILRLITEDLTNVEIGHRLNISSTTVETHRRNLMKKLEVNTAVGLMRWAYKNGIIKKMEN